MYAVIRAGGKQYRVAPGDVIKVERFTADESTSKSGKVNFDVLAVSPEAGKITKPNGSAATVTGEILDEGRAPKILVFKFKRKKQYKKMQGHRQNYAQVRITEIAFEGNKATAPELPAKKAKKAKPEGEAATAKSAKSKSQAKKKTPVAHHDTPSRKLAAANKKSKSAARKSSTTAKKAAKKSGKKK